MKNLSKAHYTQDQYMGTSINCNLTRPTLENILEALFVLIYGVTETLKYPRGYHVRTRFTDQMTSSEYSAHINNFYKSKSKYSPQRMTIIENDDTGVHHHHAIILNDKLDRKSSLQYLHAKLKKMENWMTIQLFAQNMIATVTAWLQRKTSTVTSSGWRILPKPSQSPIDISFGVEAACLHQCWKIGVAMANLTYVCCIQSTTRQTP